MKPITSAVEAVRTLASRLELIAVTVRPDEVMEITKAWIGKYLRI